MYRESQHRYLGNAGQSISLPGPPSHLENKEGWTKPVFFKYASQGSSSTFTKKSASCYSFAQVCLWVDNCSKPDLSRDFCFSNTVRKDWMCPWAMRSISRKYPAYKLPKTINQTSKTSSLTVRSLNHLLPVRIDIMVLQNLGLDSCASTPCGGQVIIFLSLSFLKNSVNVVENLALPII